MKFHGNAQAVLVCATILASVTTTYVSNSFQNTITASVETGQLDQVQSILETALKTSGENALARAAIIAGNTQVRTLFAARDRAGLAAELVPVFQQQKEKFGADQAQFHIPPAVDWLRLHAPSVFGDDQSSFRPQIGKVMHDQIPRYSFAIGRGGPALFATAPVYDRSNKPTGTFEFAMSFSGILDRLKTAYNIDTAVYVSEKPLHDVATLLPPSTFSEQNRVGSYIRYYSSNKGLFQELIKDSDLNDNSGGNFIRNVSGIHYGVVLFPLRNSRGDTVGMMAAVRDFTSYSTASNHAEIWQWLAALCVIVVQAGLITVIIRGFLLRPLAAISTALAGLSAEETEKERMIDCGITDSHKFCSELRQLVEHYEALRREKEEDPK